MSQEVVAIGNELVALSAMFLPAAPLSVLPSQLVIARAWQVNATNVLLLAANSSPNASSILLKLATSFSGTANVLYESDVSPRTVSHGVLEDSVAGYSVRIYSIDLIASDHGAHPLLCWHRPHSAHAPASARIAARE